MFPHTDTFPLDGTDERAERWSVTSRYEGGGAAGLKYWICVYNNHTMTCKCDFCHGSFNLTLIEHGQLAAWYINQKQKHFTAAPIQSQEYAEKI